MAAVQTELIARGTAARVTACDCLGPCFDGPNAVVYPDGVWYGGLTVEDAGGLAEHLGTGKIWEVKRVAPPGEDESST